MQDDPLFLHNNRGLDFLGVRAGKSPILDVIKSRAGVCMVRVTGDVELHGYILRFCGSVMKSDSHEACAHSGYQESGRGYTDTMNTALAADFDRAPVVFLRWYLLTQ